MHAKAVASLMVVKGIVVACDVLTNLTLCFEVGSQDLLASLSAECIYIGISIMPNTKACHPVR